ncbi:MAG: ABC transporter ATP-binding protein [Spirochaetales bacterium]|uniref:ABC transporter ATP-binding protein n=1 Tax=Candidatus Thalassospirochaeta sargassi TaxID=3119039 RepID=A0AAJ1IGN0_9SPIO|nr:ABC transporter ATP-binding protein [Spirochaetales bacterium]
MGNIEVRALNRVSLDISEHDFLCIMGASGSGKSTLMNIIGCLDRPSAGSYHLGGKDVSGLADEQLAAVRNKQIGFVFQTFNLLPRISARKNVELPLIYSGYSAKERRRMADIALDRVELSDRAGHKPNELSGGQRQRVAIARALVNSPSIIFADEPTGNLDSRTGLNIMALFQKLHEEGATIVMVTHEMDIALHGKRIIHLRDGQIHGDEAVKKPANAAAAIRNLADLNKQDLEEAMSLHSNVHKSQESVE